MAAIVPRVRRVDDTELAEHALTGLVAINAASQGVSSRGPGGLGRATKVGAIVPLRRHALGGDARRTVVAGVEIGLQSAPDGRAVLSSRLVHNIDTLYVQTQDSRNVKSSKMKYRSVHFKCA